ncbi:MULTISPECIES: hypothetical protein [Bacillus cereus group]|uniref:Uncharacterized protein n=1 Tax=Bacillus proteolyticus TaxID=2026192 RepID=A0ABV3IJ45_9BACI|nr:MULTISPECIES: hypothetical protein [Bacillus cereus group]MBJ8107628.1 hypothetical protein [Bacillus cereus group sp. N8]MDM5235363.1 hypothetical protein [Bacillus cereus]
MKKKDILVSIQKELEENPQTTSLDISKKYRIPFIIVEIFRIKIAKKS